MLQTLPITTTAWSISKSVTDASCWFVICITAMLDTPHFEWRSPIKPVSGSLLSFQLWICCIFSNGGRKNSTILMKPECFLTQVQREEKKERVPAPPHRRSLVWTVCSTLNSAPLLRYRLDFKFFFFFFFSQKAAATKRSRSNRRQLSPSGCCATAGHQFTAS